MVESDVGIGPFDPWPATTVHVERGVTGAALAAQRNDVVVIVDILSFSTTATIAIERDARFAALSGDQIDELGGRDAVAMRFDAHVVAKNRADTTARFTLSPASLGTVEAGDRLVLTSLNGARLVAAATDADDVVIGSLRSCSATAEYVGNLLEERPGRRATIVAADEQWSSVTPGGDGVRMALEDTIGAGAIAGALAGDSRTLSVEAAAAAATAEQCIAALADVLGDSVSGRELIARDFSADVALAAELDACGQACVRGADGFFEPH